MSRSSKCFSARSALSRHEVILSDTAQKPKPIQQTALGHEMPIPKRPAFLRDLRRVSRGADADTVLRQASKRKSKQSS
jgi:hypothetical protein